jgi:membrane-bound serine protease (ClpP class)
VSAQSLRKALERAERGRYRALVLEVDTPGGLETSMRDMVKGLLGSPVPVITWVTPGGARAASAGVFVVMAGDVAAMSPGTNIGAATPINLQGPMDSTLAAKGRQRRRGVRAHRGGAARPQQRMGRAGRAPCGGGERPRAVALPSSTSRPRRWRSCWRCRMGASGAAALARGAAHQGTAERPDHSSFGERLLALVAEPNVAYILMMLGFYGLLFELQNPGAILPVWSAASVSSSRSSPSRPCP